MKIDATSRVYVAGCGGMLGASVYKAMRARGATVIASDIDVNEDWLTYADVRDSDEMARQILDFAPDLLINLAALTDLEFCERNPDNAWLTNATAAENLGRIAKQIDCVYVYISTAGIFDGKQEMYTDFDTPNPLSVYAKSKCQAEMFVCSSIPKHFVLRAGWMMGGGPNKDKKFINKIYKQLALGSNHLRVVDDKLGTPTYTVDFAEGLIRVAESGQYGLYNQVCLGTASRYEVASEFVNLLGLREQVKIEIVPSDYFASDYFAPRPASEQLVNLKLFQRGLNVMRDWQVCLAEYAKVFDNPFGPNTIFPSDQPVHPHASRLS